MSERESFEKRWAEATEVGRVFTAIGTLLADEFSISVDYENIEKTWDAMKEVAFRFYRIGWSDARLLGGRPGEEGADDVVELTEKGRRRARK